MNDLCYPSRGQCQMNLQNTWLELSTLPALTTIGMPTNNIFINKVEACEIEIHAGKRRKKNFVYTFN